MKGICNRSFMTPAAASVAFLAACIGHGIVAPTGAFAADPPSARPEDQPIAARGIGVVARENAPLGKPQLAVVPLAKAIGAQSLGAGDSARFSDQLASQIKAGEYEVVDRARLASLMAEHHVTPADLAADDGAAIRFGRAIGVRFLIVGSIAQDSEYNVTTRMLDCQAGQVASRGATHFRQAEDAPLALTTLAANLKLRDDHPPAPDAGASLLAPVNDAFKVKLEVVPAKAIYDEGDEVSFVVSVSRDCYVTLIARDSEGKDTYLIPNPFQMNQVHLSAGQQVTFPPANAPFSFPIVPPHGQTIVKVIATTRELKLAELDRGRMLRESQGQGEKEFVQPANGARAIGVIEDPPPAPEQPAQPPSPTPTPAPTPVEPRPAPSPAAAVRTEAPAIAPPAALSVAPLSKLLPPTDWSTAEISIVSRPKPGK